MKSMGEGPNKSLSTGKGHAKGSPPIYHHPLAPVPHWEQGQWLLWEGVGQIGLMKPDATQVGTRNMHNISRWNRQNSDAEGW